MGLALETWEPFRRAIHPHRSVALDLPGIGGSTMPIVPPTIASLARITADALDELGEDHVDVLGFSFGGAIAQELARLVPDRVTSLVLAATNWGCGSPVGQPASLARWWIKGALRPGTRLMGPWAQMLAISTWSSWSWMCRLPQPTLVLAGSDDDIVPVTTARMLATAIPNATLRILDGEGHAFLLHAAPRAGRAVLDFLDEGGRATAGTAVAAL